MPTVFVVVVVTRNCVGMIKYDMKNLTFTARTMMEYRRDDNGVLHRDCSESADVKESFTK